MHNLQKAHEQDAMDDKRRNHVELLSAVWNNNWQPSRPHDIAAWSTHVDAYCATELKNQFQRMIAARLYFRHMPDRVDSIHLAHQKTFEWLFKEDVRVTDERSWSNFTTWLQTEDSSIYWITGKPGSGKSTLMKFLYHHTRLHGLLSTWAKNEELSIAGFYFWNSGNSMQISFDGLLRTLLHTCFSEDNALFKSALQERWDEFVAFGGGRDAFKEAELLRMFESVVSNTSRKFFFLIDGLDEFAGEPRKIARFVLRQRDPTSNCVSQVALGYLSRMLLSSVPAFS
jgi:hypothetical protein